mmetsp:Transcript_9603/g.31403  ORF Transcript_9603/g.31403 Transcript_9603/m.31403 type:complete len:224 (-) Transcript_9603:801-1472(-)
MPRRGPHSKLMVIGIWITCSFKSVASRSGLAPTRSERLRGAKQPLSDRLRLLRAREAAVREAEVAGPPKGRARQREQLVLRREPPHRLLLRLAVGKARGVQQAAALLLRRLAALASLAQHLGAARAAAGQPHKVVECAGGLQGAPPAAQRRQRLPQHRPRRLECRNLLAHPRLAEPFQRREGESLRGAARVRRHRVLHLEHRVVQLVRVGQVADPPRGQAVRL